jgi:hypothetical protein
MRLIGALIVAGAVASISSVLNYSHVEAQTGSTAAGGPDISSKASAAAADIKDNNFDLRRASPRPGAHVGWVGTRGSWSC